MQSKFKRTLVAVVAILFLLVGVLGLVLPILQGLLFIFVGIVLLSLVSVRVRVWMETHTNKHPKLHAVVGKVESWVEKFLGPLN
jgi:uncharacterized membrane protein YbaN (DUF454 family)